MMMIGAMTIFGTIGIFRKYIPLPSSLLALARGIIGTAFLLFLVLAVKRDKLSIEAIKRNFVFLVVSGAFIGFNWILLFEAYQYTTVATATLCYYMAPVIVVLVSPFLFKERLTLLKAICVAVALAGMVFVSGIPQSGFGGMSELKGILLGLGAATLYAIVVILNQYIKDIPAYDKTIMQLGTAAIAILPYTLLTENFADISFTPIAVLMLIFVGIVHTGIAYTLYFGSMSGLKAQTIALFSYIDPVVAIILSAVILQENIGLWGVIGAVMVLGSTMVSELFGEKK
ncbi:MAG: DMT family transporter [Peptococcaceae bacterium]|nr:DMT family transporter [Peptococcaceae bacterium]MBQ2120844.1 DMT family transporter [Peptococcaceae bacterium]